MKQSKAVLKSYFETGDRPTQEQFENLIDSFVHEDDITKIYVSSVERNEATGDSVIRLSNGSKLLIQNPANVVIQDNKIKVVDLGNIRLNEGGVGVVRKEGEARRESMKAIVDREIVEEPSRIDTPIRELPVKFYGIEGVLAATVNRLNPPVVIEEDEIVVFQYNIVQQITES
ncbi:hypothetical protein [Tenacibaculum sp. 190524A05c]|uniref:Uncharacterized protein n=1 Tax=Tenacibaculum platacis TaxID=3137852 RepID=A0ABP1EX88_9FLAO